MSQQPEPPTEGDEEFERKVQERMADQQEDGADEDPTDVAQEDHKSEVPELEENEESPVDPGSV
ncbi:hypothetical protein CIK52_14930 [Kocuria rosea]|uniref:hypothetical protein n=1 Tax=Kocuria rosea TaxID=1275 RepID=UPI000D65E7CE|nr:hypothetical protein [Kocuria rosea]MEB2525814.1 hypothetical protein [Kocuria rosea]MEB2617206.1 hypothetical protein [Kocuria rosea]PWF83585.1 hypothetical protein CIK52_14930 [Kocuria rosea]QCY31902.1 hypothetical protein EQG70_02685 [Kocuria rosea]TQN39353.1 hypothetical protein FHX38_1198 [Kocuria rosea]